MCNQGAANVLPDEGSGRADFGGADHKVERADGTLIARSRGACVKRAVIELAMSERRRGSNVFGD